MAHHPQAEPATPSTQERIRSIASVLFAERGYGGTSMSQIAQQVGISKAGLYNYYTSKEALFTELVTRCMEAWIAVSQAPLREATGYRQRLWEHFRASVSFTREHPHEVALLRLAVILVGGERGERVQQPLEGFKVKYLEDLDSFFRQAVADGALDAAGDPPTLALTFSVFLDGVLFNTMFGDPLDKHLDQHLETLFQPLWRGLGGQPGAR